MHTYLPAGSPEGDKIRMYPVAGLNAGAVKG
jgi:hypothetical protein